MPNTNQEQLVAINFERLKYWLGYGVECSKPVEKLLGAYFTFTLTLVH